MTLSAGTMTYNGVTIGPGNPALIVSVDGLTGLPTNRSGDVSRPHAAGMLAGEDWPGDRSITLNMSVAAGNGNTMGENLNALRQAFLMSVSCGGGVLGLANGVASPQLVYNIWEGSGGVGENRMVTARCRKFDVTADIGFEFGIANIACLLDAVDPRIYDASTQSATVGLTVATGGLTFPVTFPATFGSQSGGFIYATNSGTVPCPPYLEITGPCTNPRIEQQTSGVTIQFDTTLAASDVLVIDCYAGSAILNGTASRLNVLAPGSYINTLTIPPGTNTLGFYSSDSSATGATLTATWSNCWA